jgi:prepilin-type processing-associated H-X9-DG protein
MNLNPAVPEENNLRSHYVGIMGARPGPTLTSAGLVTEPACTPPSSTGRGGGGGVLEWPATTYIQHNCGGTGSGGTAINGVIYPLAKVKFKDITDGTSKTMMFGEMSWTVGPQAAWIVGSTSKDPDNAVSSSHGWVYNTKVVRWPINEKKSGEPDITAPGGFVQLPGVTYVLQTEESLGSNHPGGTNVAMCDGSAGFISEEVDVEKVLRPMASRYSGDVYDSPF